MESIGFVLSTTQVVAQVASAVKRHLEAFSNLEQLARSVEYKSVHCLAAAKQMAALAAIPGIGGVAFQRTHRSLQEIYDMLTRIQGRIERWRTVRLLVFQAPVLERELREVDQKLDQLEQHFGTISILGGMISSNRTEIRENAVTMLTAVLSTTVDSEETRRVIIAEYEATVQARASYDGCLEPEAEFNYAMGLTQFDVMPQKFRIMGTAPHKVQKATRYLRRACALGKREAFRYLGDIYCDGIATERCYRTAFEYYEKGTARSDAGATFALGWCYNFGHSVTESIHRAIELYNEAIDLGCAEAMEIMGFLKLVPRSYREAARLLGKAESMNVFAAKQSYGLCYAFGLGVERNASKAFELFNESFQGGNLFAAIQLADCYDTGLGVEHNPAAATAVFERCMKAMSDANQSVQPMYGLRLIQGIGVEKDVARGKALIIDARTSSRKWFALGECYRNGTGFQQDKRRAKKFFRKAVECSAGGGGRMLACIALAEMFEAGDGVIADIHRASKYYLIAADHRQPKAQWKVALAYESGVGLPKNVHKAVFYFEMCANSGDSAAQRKCVSYYVQGHGVERPRDSVAKMVLQAAREGNWEAKSWFRRHPLSYFREIIRSSSW